MTDDLIERCAKAAYKSVPRDLPLNDPTYLRLVARAVLAVAIPPGSCVVRVDDLDAALDAAGQCDDYFQRKYGYTSEVSERLHAASREGDDNGK
jgi:hypothetical protein